jgi:uncharacterized protein (TIGR00299 family) protein
MNQHIHLDLVGGISGDMFVAAMLDTFPDQADGLADVIVAAGFPDLVRLEYGPHSDGTLTGTRFRVFETQPAAHNKESSHNHRHYSEIKEVIEKSSLCARTKAASLSMFESIAVVEAEIHGKEVAEVAFHEVGAWDSIADILLAAHLIETLDVSSWSISKVPLGSGFVKTDHGRLPIPAPATSRLLEGFEVYDDGVAGERVTPTGAAILKYLAPGRRVPGGAVLDKSGFGFGTKQFPGFSNIVRATLFSIGADVFDGADGSHERPWQEDRVTQLAFELDDQTPESIAAALDVIRTHDGVLDALQSPFWGKKGRQGAAIKVLVREGDEQAVISLCFAQTSTLGIRQEIVTRAILTRETVTVRLGELNCRVKVARRPSGYTAKAEMDDLVATNLGYEAREAFRMEAEQAAIKLIQERTEPE